MHNRIHTISPHWLGAFHQLFDPALPTGSYAHSFGHEGLVQLGELENMSDLRQFIENEVGEALVRVDLPLLAHAHQACVEQSFGKLPSLEQLALAVIPTGELRRASVQVGSQLWKLYGNLLESGSSERTAFDACGDHLNNYPSVVVHGCLCACIGIPTTVAMEGYCRQQVINFIQPALKLLRTGPAEVQKVVHILGVNFPDWVEAALSVGLDEIGSMCPRWDIASARHETSGRRLYIS